jgi:hypothetical protein
MDTIDRPTSFPSISYLRSLSGTKNSAVPQLKQISTLGREPNERSVWPVFSKEMDDDLDALPARLIGDKAYDSDRLD